MNLALKCWFPQRNNTTLLTAKLSPYNFTYLLFNLRFIIENIKIYCRRLRLFISEWDETCDWLQITEQLNTTSFEAFELEIAVNYPVHTWTENSSFMWNLTSWLVPFWLVLLTEHKVLHFHATNAVYRCLVAGQLYPSCRFSSADCRCFQLSNRWEIHSTSFVHHNVLTDRF